MTPEEEFAMQQQEQQRRTGSAQESLLRQQEIAQSHVNEEQQVNTIKEQLDLDKEKEEIKNLLRGNVKYKDEYGRVAWKEPENKDLVILSEYGSHLIMNVIDFYLNKNTLLSNYDEETINIKMEDLSIELADIIFMEYEKVFEYPTLEDCKKVFNDRLERKKEMKKFAKELLHQEYNDKETEKELLDELEDRLEKELEKIKEQIMKDKLKRFGILLREVQDSIHSAYLRAYQGQERRTLRQHWHISEARGGVTQPEKTSKLNPFNWAGGRK